MSEVNQAREYFLGGGVSSRVNWTRGFLIRMALIGATTIGMIVVMSMTQSVWATLPGVIFIALLFFLPQLRTAAGDLRVDIAHGWLQRLALKVIRWSEFDPSAESVPAPLGKIACLAPSAAPGKPELAVIEHESDQYFSVVLRLDGLSTGIVSAGEDDFHADKFGALLRNLAEGGVVSQVDFAVRVAPCEPDDHDAWVSEHAAVKSGVLANVLGDLSRMIPRIGCEYLIWMVLRIPTEKVKERLADEGLRPTTEALAEAVFDLTGEITQLVENAGLRPRFGVPPASLGALIRHLYLPEYHPDELQGITNAWSGFVPYKLDPTGRALVTTGASGKWFHSVGEIPREGWPAHAVTADWLDPLVVGGEDEYRLVLAQFPLIRAKKAIRRAQAATAAALANEKGQAGSVSDGSDAYKAEAGTWMLEDISVKGASGVTPVLRVLVSETSMRNLREARTRVEDAITAAMGAKEFSWADYDHARHFVTMLPMARGAKQ